MTEVKETKGNNSIQDQCSSDCKKPKGHGIMTTFGIGFGSGFLGALTLMGVMKLPEIYYGSTGNATNLTHSTYTAPRITENHSGGLQQCSSLETQVENLTASITRLRRELSRNQTDLRNDMSFKNYMVHGKFDELDGQYLSKVWLFVILLLAVFETAVMVVVWNMWRQLADVLSRGLGIRGQEKGRGPGTGPDPVGFRGRATEEIRGHERTLQMIRHGGLDRSVCVVTFHRTTLAEHSQKIKTLLNQDTHSNGLQVVQVHVAKHDDILQLPRCKLYFVFVDFNERNIILEDPNKGLGDLRLTLVQAVHLMGGDAVVIYCGDTGSRSLKGDTIYNPDLTSVTQHSELRRLSNRRRMLSLFDEFSQNQRKHITGIINDTCR